MDTPAPAPKKSKATPPPPIKIISFADLKKVEGKGISRASYRLKDGTRVYLDRYPGGATYAVVDDPSKLSTEDQAEIQTLQS